jgi:hypothetical protein
VPELLTALSKHEALVKSLKDENANLRLTQQGGAMDSSTSSRTGQTGESGVMVVGTGPTGTVRNMEEERAVVLLRARNGHLELVLQHCRRELEAERDAVTSLEEQLTAERAEVSGLQGRLKGVSKDLVQAKKQGQEAGNQQEEELASVRASMRTAEDYQTLKAQLTEARASAGRLKEDLTRKQTLLKTSKEAVTKLGSELDEARRAQATAENRASVAGKQLTLQQQVLEHEKSKRSGSSKLEDRLREEVRFLGVKNKDLQSTATRKEGHATNLKTKLDALVLEHRDVPLQLEKVEQTLKATKAEGQRKQVQLDVLRERLKEAEAAGFGSSLFSHSITHYIQHWDSTTQHIPHVGTAGGGQGGASGGLVVRFLVNLAANLCEEIDRLQAAVGAMTVGESGDKNGGGVSGSGSRGSAWGAEEDLGLGYAASPSLSGWDADELSDILQSTMRLAAPSTRQGSRSQGGLASWVEQFLPKVVALCEKLVEEGVGAAQLLGAFDQLVQQRQTLGLKLEALERKREADALPGPDEAKALAQATHYEEIVQHIKSQLVMEHAENRRKGVEYQATIDSLQGQLTARMRSSNPGRVIRQ